jgi:IS30 family transposase
VVATTARPLTDDERRRVAELHAAGKTRNEIARAIGRAQSTVSKLAAEQGLTFDRSRTKAATAAKVVDAKARRADLAAALLEDAHRLRAQLWKPCKAFNFGGKDNTYAEVQLDEPTFADKLKLVQAAGVAIDKHARLAEMDADLQGLAAVDAWLRDITGTP